MNMTFNEYLIQEYGQNWQGIHMDLIVEGYNEDELDDRYWELRSEFDDYCEDNDIEATIE